ncbi:MAG: helix-turn-helix domain-containing protein [Treponema sp.]|jgi:transcriptional regulator with XRE-family HTH domain|nr:helix-turn-helix domain-containing protein [Treponema sp.]
MIGIGKRLIKVRAEIGLKQGEFAERIGISQGMLSDIEHENKPLTERNIKLIHLTFGVNREWLLTGQGEMFNHLINPPPPFDEEPLESNIEEDDIDSLPPDEKAFLLDYRRLTEPNKKVAKTMVKSLLSSQVETEASHEKKITVIQTFEKIGEKQSFL